MQRWSRCPSLSTRSTPWLTAWIAALTTPRFGITSSVSFLPGRRVEPTEYLPFTSALATQFRGDRDERPICVPLSCAFTGQSAGASHTRSALGILSRGAQPGESRFSQRRRSGCLVQLALRGSDRDVSNRPHRRAGTVSTIAGCVGQTDGTDGVEFGRDNFPSAAACGHFWEEVGGATRLEAHALSPVGLDPPSQRALDRRVGHACVRSRAPR
jgi:hypothetical protein